LKTEAPDTCSTWFMQQQLKGTVDDFAASIPAGAAALAAVETQATAAEAAALEVAADRVG
jgi:hypothetical protein